MTDTMIVSDLHLGSPLSRSEDLLNAIKREDPNELILNGDVLSGSSIFRLSANDFKLLTFLRRRAEKKYVIWVQGNHDFHLDHIAYPLLGIDIDDEYWFSWNDKDCLVIHGHQFDKFILKHSRFSNFISSVYLQLQKVPFIRDHVAEWAEEYSSQWQRLTPVVAKLAQQYGVAHEADVVFCGHTHHMYSDVAEDMQYYNSGCFVGSKANYIRITGDKLEMVDYGL
jgi:predicted phosphodiesterase